MRRHRRDYEVMSEMNLTNLLDTAFVLLIAFIMASPSMRQGLQIDLPKVGGPAEALVQKSKEVLTITLRKNPLQGAADQIVVGEARLDLDQLSAMIDLKKASTKDLDVILEADKAVTYETVAQVIGILKNRGIENVGLPTEPADAQSDEKGKTKSKK